MIDLDFVVLASVHLYIDSNVIYFSSLIFNDFVSTKRSIFNKYKSFINKIYTHKNK